MICLNIGFTFMYQWNCCLQFPRYPYVTTEWWQWRTLVNCPTRQCAPWEQWIPFALPATPFVHFDQTVFLIHLMVTRISKSAQSCLFFIQARPFGMISIPQSIQEDIFAIPNSHLGSPRGPAPAQQGLRTCVTTLWRRVSVAWSRSTSRAWEGQSYEEKMSPDFQMSSVRLLPCP